MKHFYQVFFYDASEKSLAPKIEILYAGQNFRAAYELLLEKVLSMEQPLSCRTIAEFLASDLNVFLEKKRTEFNTRGDEFEGSSLRDMYDNYESYITATETRDSPGARAEFYGKYDYDEPIFEDFESEFTMEFMIQNHPGLLGVNSSQMLDVLQSSWGNGPASLLQDLRCPMAIAFYRNREEYVSWDDQAKSGFSICGPLSLTRIQAMNNPQFWPKFPPEMFGNDVHSQI